MHCTSALTRSRYSSARCGISRGGDGQFGPERRLAGLGLLQCRKDRRRSAALADSADEVADLAIEALQFVALALLLDGLRLGLTRFDGRLVDLFG